MKISHLIFFSFLLILLLFSITTYINYRQSERVKDNAEFLDRSSTIVRQTGRFQRNILNMVSGLRGYLLNGGVYFIQTYDSAVVENENILKELDNLIQDTASQQASLTKIRNLNSLWTNEFTEPLLEAKKLATASDTGRAAYSRLYREKFLSNEQTSVYNMLQEEVRVLTNDEYRSREIRKAILDESVRNTRQLSFFLTLFSIVAGFAIATLLAYSISKRILKMVRMANTIAAGNYYVTTKDTGRDELSKLARSLNHMSKVLSENISLLQRKNKELDQFAQIVSHDLKTPLRGISNVVSWIEEDHNDEMSPKVNEYLQLIKGRLNRSENLIRGILSYARVGKEVQQKEEVDINLLIEEISEGLTLKPGLTLQYKNMPVLYTEKLPLLQIFSNLISNAVKYHNKPKGEVKVYYSEYEKYFTFYVEDNGPGIADNYHDKIFRIFQTLEQSETLESTGVGLAIVKKILDERNEKINVSSKPDEGAIFSFTWSK